MHPAALLQICAGIEFGSMLEQAVVAVRADIGNAEGGVACDFLLDRQIPFLNRGSFGIGLNSLRRVGRASSRKGGAARRRIRDTRCDRYDRGKRTGKCERSVVRRQRIEQKSEIVNQGIVGAKAGAHRRSAIPENVPGQADAGLNNHLALFWV